MHTNGEPIWRGTEQISGQSSFGQANIACTNIIRYMIQWRHHAAGMTVFLGGCSPKTYWRANWDLQVRHRHVLAALLCMIQRPMVCILILFRHPCWLPATLTLQGDVIVPEDKSDERRQAIIVIIKLRRICLSTNRALLSYHEIY